MHYELVKKFLERERELKEKLIQEQRVKPTHVKCKVQTTEIKCPYCHFKINDTESDYYEPTVKVSLGSQNLTSFVKSHEFALESFISENYDGSPGVSNRFSPSSSVPRTLPRLD